MVLPDFKYENCNAVSSFTVLRHIYWNTFICSAAQCFHQFVMVFIESAKLRALRAHVPTCFACLRALVRTCFACLRAQLAALRAYVLTCRRALRAFCAYVPTCSRDVTTNNKNKFSIICFPYIFVIVLSFSCQIKLLFLLLIPAFNKCYDRLCKIKWFDFCLNITLRVIFKWLMKGERWILVCGS